MTWTLRSPLEEPAIAGRESRCDAARRRFRGVKEGAAHKAGRLVDGEERRETKGVSVLGAVEDEALERLDVRADLRGNRASSRSREAERVGQPSLEIQVAEAARPGNAAPRSRRAPS